MFSQSIVESDAFLDMPLTSQALYLHFCMNADDDGFFNPKRIIRMVGANEDDFKILVAKRFLIVFESGVAVVKHWHISNAIRKDRYTKTTYIDELSSIKKNKNGGYTEREKRVRENVMATNGQPNVIPSGVVGKVNKVSIGKGSINTLAQNAPDSELGKMYFKVIKKLSLPVRNFNNVKSTIKKMENEGLDEDNKTYLEFMLNDFRTWRHRYKPEVNEALDIYAKRNSIVSKMNKPARGVKL